MLEEVSLKWLQGYPVGQFEVSTKSGWSGHSGAECPLLSFIPNVDLDQFGNRFIVLKTHSYFPTVSPSFLNHCCHCLCVLFVDR